MKDKSMKHFNLILHGARKARILSQLSIHRNAFQIISKQFDFKANFHLQMTFKNVKLLG